MFPKSVSPDKAVRAASLKLGEELSNYGVDLGAREDVYAAFLVYLREGYPAEKASLSAEERRVVERMERGFRREGMNLPAHVRASLTTMRKRLSKLDSENQACLDNLETILRYTDAELAGVPPSFMAGRKVDASGRREVTLSGPDTGDVLKYCTVRATRRAVSLARSQRCQAENTPRMEEAQQLRGKIAKTLGYKNYAAEAIEVKMAKTPEAVFTFLDSLKDKVRSAYGRYRRKLSCAKQFVERSGQKAGAAGRAASGKKAGGAGDETCKLNGWDHSFYSQVIIKNDFKVRWGVRWVAGQGGVKLMSYV